MGVTGCARCGSSVGSTLCSFKRFFEVIFCAYYLNDRDESSIRAAALMDDPSLHATSYNVYSFGCLYHVENHVQLK
jgi:hypothetical protein